MVWGRGERAGWGDCGVNKGSGGGGGDTSC